MTELFKIGLETGDFSEFTSHYGTQTVVTSPVHHGTYALQTAASSSASSKGTTDETTEKWLYFNYRFSRLLTGSQEIVFVGCSDGVDSQWNLTYVGPGELGICQIAVYKSSAPTFEVKWWIPEGDFDPNVDHAIKIRHKSGSGNAEIDLYVDDMETPKLQITNVTFNTPTTYSFGDLDSAGGGNYTGWHDCIAGNTVEPNDPFTAPVASVVCDTTVTIGSG